MLIFDDESSNDWNRQKALERLSLVTLPQNLQPQMGTDWSPVGQIFWYTLRSTNPRYDLMELKSIEDWTLEKQFKSVPNVVDVRAWRYTRNTRSRWIQTNSFRTASASARSNNSLPTTTPTLVAASSRLVCSKSTSARWAV